LAHLEIGPEGCDIPTFGQIARHCRNRPRVRHSKLERRSVMSRLIPFIFICAIALVVWGCTLSQGTEPRAEGKPSAAMWPR
jgi:hypothetical protein